MELIQKLASIVADYSQEQPEIFIKSKLDALKKNGFKEKEGKDASYYRAFHALKNGEVQTDEELRSYFSQWYKRCKLSFIQIALEKETCEFINADIN
jgi:hypothetical protein